MEKEKRERKGSKETAEDRGDDAFASGDEASSSLPHRSGISLRSTDGSARARHARAGRLRSGKASRHALTSVTTCWIAAGTMVRSPRGRVAPIAMVD